MTTTDHGLPRESFFRDYGDALTHRTAAVFAGAGLSRAAGHVDWRGLLQEFADELGIDLDLEQDLVSVAQYHLNAQGGTRGRLNQKIVDEFAPLKEVTAAHRTLMKLPIDLFWTTNYDSLLERAAEDVGRIPDVKLASGSLSVTVPNADVTIRKLHGDLSDPDHIVITRDDYEEYVDTHPLFRGLLQADLSSRTFLFVGFSFTDPHLDFILGELRRLNRTSPRPHFVILKRETSTDFASRRQTLRIEDLKRYGLNTVLVDEYDEIPALLDQLRLRFLRRQVFVSGAAADFEPLGRDWLDEFGAIVGDRLIARQYNIVSGFGAGVAGRVVFGALERLYGDPGPGGPSVDKRLILRPFPGPSTAASAEVYKQYREDMLTTVGFATFVSGNRPDGTGGVEVSTGVLDEFEIAVANGVYPLPLGASGWAAEQIWNAVNADMDTYFPETKPPADAWATLNDAGASPSDAVDALITIMDALRP